LFTEKIRGKFPRRKGRQGMTKEELREGRKEFKTPQGGGKEKNVEYNKGSGNFSSEEGPFNHVFVCSCQL